MTDRYILKFCVIGSNFKLNTQVIHLVAGPLFDIDYSPTIGVAFATAVLTVQSEEVKLIIYISRIEEYFKQLRQLYYEGSVAGVIIFDKSDRSSFDTVTHWCSEYREVQGSEKPIVLLGIITHADEITSEEGTQLATRLNCLYFESTPKDQMVLLEIFTRLFELYIEDLEFRRRV
ncbi:MAG: hypothetical protein ACW98F_13295 [Candidatus Hodarchaeales archaeon]|jgi:GTPase SAR1 family protein